MATATQTITGEELFQMADIGPCELIDGAIVPMSPPGGEHASYTANITFYLMQYVKAHDLGRVVTGEGGLYTRRNPDRVRAMDAAFFSKQRLPGDPPTDYFEIAPEVVIEVISPHDRWQEVRLKMEEYFSIGVEQVWLVEPKRRTVSIYRSLTDITEFKEADTLTADGALMGFSVAVHQVFE